MMDSTMMRVGVTPTKAGLDDVEPDPSWKLKRSTKEELTARI
jgi:hypothetical protein